MIGQYEIYAAIFHSLLVKPLNFLTFIVLN